MSDQNSYEITPIEPTEFFDPATYPFETFGMAEELIDLVTCKCVGIRRVAKADRPLGSQGWINHTITEPIKVGVGHKTVILKASPKKPLVLRGHLYPLCGRKKE